MDEKQFHALAADIAKALGGAVTRRNDTGNPPFADFGTRDALPLNVATVWNDASKLRISVVMPRKEDSACRYSVRDMYARNEVTPDTEIGVSAAKGAERIAADIKRRLIPGATDAHRRAVERRNADNAYRAAKAATVARLCKALKCEARGEMVYAGACSFQVSGPESIQIDRLYVTPDTALKIHALLKADKGGE
ncbi:MAG TPA: hypothetical protein VFB63_19580 [Bryobacteraceae bacterium]|nr:hypothetical protein [Bryobacteraceae bacterium]